MPPFRTLPIVIAVALAGPTGASAQFRPGGPAESGPAGGGDQNAVYVRDSGVAVEKMALAERLVRQKEWDKAADVYTEIAQKYADRVVPSMKDKDDKPTQYVSAARAVQDKLAAWPAEGLDAYRRRFEDTARDLLNGPAPDAAARVAALYYATDAGRDAALSSMSAAFERGDVATAAAVGRRLLETHPGLQTERPRVIVQTAVADRLAGRASDAAKWLDELKARHADAVVHVAGRDVKAIDALAGALNVPATAAVFRGDDWPTAFGTPDAAGVPEQVSAGGARLFGVELASYFPRGAAVTRSPELRQHVAALRSAGSLTGVLPSVDGGELFFQDNARVYGLNLASGQPLAGWQQTYGDARGAYTMDSAGGTPAGKQFAVAVTPTSVVALLGQNDMSHTQYGLPTTTPQIVCLDRATGRRLWDATPNRLKLPDDQSGLKSGAFYGNPLVDGDTVYALLNASRGGQFEECYVVALDRADGAFKWAAYVASVSLGNRAFGMDGEAQSTTGTAAALSISGGRLYVLTNLGALACLDGGTGDVLWLNVYPRPAARRGNVRGFQPMAVETAKPFLSGPPVVSGGRVFAMPQDASAMFVCDAATGAAVAEVPKQFDAGEGRERLDAAATLVGVVGDQAVVASGRTVFKVPWAKYDPAQSIWDNGGVYKKIPQGENDKADRADTVRGRPFLTATELIVPSADRLHRIALKSFKTVAEYPVLPATWGEDESTGNVLATPDHLVVAGPQRVTVYADLAAATTKLDARIEAAPDDPEAYARYAELLLAAGRVRPGLEKFDAAAGKAGGLANLTPGATRDRLFEIAMAFAVRSQRANPDPAASAPLFDRAASAARSPQQQVRYRLARALAFRANADGTDELALMQEILATPAWSAVSVPGRAAGNAGDAAEAAVAELVRQYGRTIYASYDAAAAARLAELQAATPPDPAKLMELAATYPSANVTPDALTAAADAFEAANLPQRAALPLRQLLRRDVSNERRQLALQALARNALKTRSQVAIARVRLKQAKSVAPSAKLLKPLTLADGTPLNAATVAEAIVVLDAAADRLNAEALPTFGLPVPAKGRGPALSPPRVVAPASALIAQPKDAVRNDRVLTYGPDRAVRVVDAVTGGVTLTEATPQEPPLGGGYVGDTLLIIDPGGVSAVDTSGKKLWETAVPSLPAVELSGQATAVEPAGPQRAGQAAVNGNGLVVVNGQVGNGQVFQVPGQAAIALGEGGDAEAPAAGPERVTQFRLAGDRVVVATTTGRVAAFDASRGTLLWQNRVHEAAPARLLGNDDFVAAAFIDPNAGNAGAVHAFDAATGRTVYAKRYESVPGAAVGLVNAALSPDGVLVTMLAGRLTGVDLYAPTDREWRYDPSATRLNQPNVALLPFHASGGDDQLVIAGDRVLAVFTSASEQQSVHMYDLSTLRPIMVKKEGTGLDAEAAFGPRDTLDSRPVTVRAAGAMFYVLAQRGLAAWPIDENDTTSSWTSSSGAGNRKTTLDVAVCRDTTVMFAPKTAVPEGAERIGDLNLLVYSRAPVPASDGGRLRPESGALQVNATLRDPAGFVNRAWQVTDGAFFYVSGDGQLKVCRAAKP